MAKIQVTLVDKQRKDVAKLSVEAELIVETACIEYENKFYIYSGQEGRFFTGVVFMEVKPPVKLK